jgi:hypothetical protein
MGSTNKKDEMTTHLQFAQKSQLLRWFHDRTIRELRAMKKGLLAADTAKEGRQQCK